MRIYFVIFYVSLVFLSVSCSNGHSKGHKESGLPPQSLLDSNGNKKKFDRLLADVSKHTALDFNSEVIANPSFRVIYEHSSAYLEDVCRFLSKGEFNSMQASVCIFAMQNLTVADYVKICRLYYKLYTDNKINEKLLEQAILPNFLESLIIGENYDELNVKSLLNDIKRNARISPEFRREIEDLQSGKYLKN